MASWWAAPRSRAPRLRLSAAPRRRWPYERAAAAHSRQPLRRRGCRQTRSACSEKRSGLRRRRRGSQAWCVRVQCQAAPRAQAVPAALGVCASAPVWFLLAGAPVWFLLAGTPRRLRGLQCALQACNIQRRETGWCRARNAHACALACLERGSTGELNYTQQRPRLPRATGKPEERLKPAC